MEVPFFWGLTEADIEMMGIVPFIKAIFPLIL